MGRTEIGGTYNDRGTWFRMDQFTADTGEIYTERYFAGGKNDTSRHVVHYNPSGPTEYNSDCPCCYLGFGHTLSHHTLSLQRHEAATKPR